MSQVASVSQGIRRPLILLSPVVAVLLCLVANDLQAGDEVYKLGPDSQRQEGVPVGKVTEYTWTESTTFPGTKRRYWVYVPAQYNGETPAAVMVFQDGHAYVDETGQFRVPIVFDNLIHAGTMPVTVGIFIDPGHIKPQLPEKAGWNPSPENRSVEYDTLSNAYATFVIDEILPAVAKELRLTDDPNLCDWRDQFGGHLCLHCRLGTPGDVSQGAESCRQLHEHSWWSRL